MGRSMLASENLLQGIAEFPAIILCPHKRGAAAAWPEPEPSRNLAESGSRPTPCPTTSLTLPGRDRSDCRDRHGGLFQRRPQARSSVAGIVSAILRSRRHTRRRLIDRMPSRQGWQWQWLHR